MAKIFTDEFGQYIKAKVVLELDVYIDDDFLEVNRKTAVQLTQDKLFRLAESNDGSELLSNISDSAITVEGDGRE
jgi:hypothetical protein